VERYERMQQHIAKTGEIVFDVPVTTPETTTYISIHPHGRTLTADFLNSLDLPMKNVRPAVDEATGHPYFVGDFTHPSEKIGWECIETYKSGYTGTSLIVPFWGQIHDPVIIHLMTLYALSIVVRYLPLLWHEIEDGGLDHIRALIEHYISVFDNVLPKLAIERITGRRLITVMPGSLEGPA
jgi:hypothetical protein